MLDVDLGVSGMLREHCWAEANDSNGLLKLGKWDARAEVRDGAHRVRASPLSLREPSRDGFTDRVLAEWGM